MDEPIKVRVYVAIRWDHDAQQEFPDLGTIAFAERLAQTRANLRDDENRVWSLQNPVIRIAHCFLSEEPR